jgi:hypothetical protein
MMLIFGYTDLTIRNKTFEEGKFCFEKSSHRMTLAPQSSCLTPDASYPKPFEE